MKQPELNDVIAAVKAHIPTLLAPESKNLELGPESKLISAGVLDSVAALKLVAYLEDKYDIEIDPEELSTEYLDTPKRIAELVLAKRAAKM